MGGLLVSYSSADTVKTPAPVSGRTPSNVQHIIPADVLARVKLLSAELYFVRQALGKAKEHQSIISVSGASPREVYFEAQALYEKANRLSYEVMGSYKKSPTLHAKNLVPAHVWQLVDAALKRVVLVKVALDIKGKPAESQQALTTTPTDVFNSILQANQELNSLLYKRVAPSDVFEQVTIAINYMASLLQYLDVSPRIPENSTFVPNKTPSEVYKRLVTCIRLLESIAKQSGLKMLSLKINELGSHQTTPSNVFDLSKIVVAEVRYLNTLISNDESVRAYDPGYKVPSDVFQRSSILLKQLKALDQAVKKDPNWLKDHGDKL